MGAFAWLLAAALADPATPLGPVAWVDTGAERATPAARSAVAAALDGHIAGDPAVRAVLTRSGPAEMSLERATAAFERGRTAFGAHDCAQAGIAFDQAEAELARTAFSTAREQWTAIYRYRLACAREATPPDDARVALLGGLVGRLLDPGYDAHDAPRVPIKLELVPADAAIVVDGRPEAADNVALPAGAHLLAAERPGFQPLTRLIQVSAPETAVAMRLEPLGPEVGGAAAELTAAVAALVAGPPTAAALQQIAQAAGTPRVLCVQVQAKTRQVTAQLYASPSPIAIAHYRGRLGTGEVPGLHEFVTQPAPILLGKNGGAAPEHDALWRHWYTWVITGGLVAVITLLAVSSSGSSDQLNVRVMR
jgi:hypothetical protein